MAARRGGEDERTRSAMALALALLVPLVARTSFAEADTPHCPQGCSCRTERTGELWADCALRGLATLPHVPHRIEALSAAGNNFPQLDEDFLGDGSGPRSRLRRLDLSNCSIARVHLNAFKPVPDLWTLNLTNNQLQKLDPFTFTRTPQLWQLSLRANVLDASAAPLLVASKLARLDLGANGLRSLPGNTFGGTPLLLSLSLADNRLRDVDANWFRPLPQLRQLLLQNNALTTLSSDAFAHAPKLFELNLSGNRLVLPSGRPFLRAPNLEKLYLNSCGLGDLPQDAFDLAPSLRILWLANNRLRHLHLQQLQDLQALYYFNACGNAFLCDCALGEVHSWAAYQGVHADVSCYTDEKEALAAARAVENGDAATEECDASWDVLDQINCNATEAAGEAAGVAAGETAEGESSLSTLAGYVAVGVAVLLSALGVAAGALYWMRARVQARPDAAHGHSARWDTDALPLQEERDDECTAA